MLQPACADQHARLSRFTRALSKQPEPLEDHRLLAAVRLIAPIRASLCRAKDQAAPRCQRRWAGVATTAWINSVPPKGGSAVPARGENRASVLRLASENQQRLAD
jgi:hypothetical protein